MSGCLAVHVYGRFGKGIPEGMLRYSRLGLGSLGLEPAPLYLVLWIPGIARAEDHSLNL